MSDAQDSPHQRAFSALLDACRLWLGSTATGAIDNASLDWERFADLAFVHNLEPLLHHLRSEGRFPRSDVPSALCDRWEKTYFENFVFNTRALEIMQPFCEACEDKRLPIAFIKGPVSAARVFGDPALRIMVDLDILCRESDLRQLVQLADEAGFGGAEENAVYHVTLQHDELAILLELHFELYDFLPRGCLEHVLDSAEPCHQDDFVFPAASPHAEIAVEIAHLVNHDLQVTLKPLLDLAGGLRAQLDTALLSQTLKNWDLEPEAALVGRLLENLFDVQSLLGRYEMPAYGEPILAAATRSVSRAEQFAQPALAELMARPGVGTKLDYLRRLLRSSGTRLAATAADTPAGGPPARWVHLMRAFGRGWAKLTRAGLASAASPSIKRELFRRRAAGS